MKVNKKLLPLKFHFFIFWASYSSALPFMMVVARQLGVPVGVQGTIFAAIITVAVLAKPIISAAADSLPRYRKAIFVSLLVVMVVAIGPIGFLPPMYSPPFFTGRLLQNEISEATNKSSNEFYLLTDRRDSCLVTTGWDCTASCKEFEICPLGNAGVKGLKLTHKSIPTVLESTSRSSEFGEVSSSSHMGEIYKLEGNTKSFSDVNFNISVSCAGGDRSGKECEPPWHTWVFWVYVLLLLAGQVAATTAESVSDAICLDTIGEDGDYGSQRAWGALSYGILGTVSGILVDWHSGTNFMKDYTAAFLLLVVFGTLDVLLSAFYLPVPKFEEESTVWKKLRPLLAEPRFFIFLCFTFLVGFYDGVDTGYVFILQEDIAAGTEVMNHMKLLQGLTMLVQAVSAAPFMFVYDWFMRIMGSQKVISLVFFLYTIRLLGLALAGYMKLVWATIAIEIINGPCFGLGFVAVIVHASSITPPGTSATVQSVVGICYGTFGYAGASLIGGLLYEAFGGEWLYFVTGALAAVTCILHLSSLKFLSPVPEKKEGDQSIENKDMRDSQKSLMPNGVTNGHEKFCKHPADTVTMATEEERLNLLQKTDVERMNLKPEGMTPSESGNEVDVRGNELRDSLSNGKSSTEMQVLRTKLDDSITDRPNLLPSV